MKPQPLVLHFWPGGGAAVRDLRAMRARPDNPEFIGMRLNEEAGGLVETSEPGRVVVLPEHATLDLPAYGKDVRAGHLVPADEATAAQFNVKYEPRAPVPPEALGLAATVPEGAAPAEERPDAQALEGISVPADGQPRNVHLEASPWGDMPPVGPGVETELREAPALPPAAVAEWLSQAPEVAPGLPPAADGTEAPAPDQPARSGQPRAEKGRR